MATTSTPFTPPRQRLGFIAEIPIQDLPVPKAELIFAQSAQTITAAAAGEDQQFTITCQLPASFGYVLTEGSVFLRDAETGDIDDWSADLTCTLTNGDWLAAQALIGGLVVPNTSILADRSYSLKEPSQKIVEPIGTTGNMFIRGWNKVIDGGPMTIWFLFRFLEFDLRQVHHWAINTPFPIRG